MKKHTCLICLICVLFGCYKETQPAVNSVIPEFYANTYTAPADGASTVNLTADIPGNTVAGGYSLLFFSTMGLFYDSQKSTTTITSLRPLPDSSYRAANAILVCPADTGTAQITVTAVDISRSLSIHFIQALPQSVKLGTSLQYITQTPPTTEATLTLSLIRSTGIATPGITVEASASDTLGKPIGSFRNGSTVLSDKTGNATIYFSPAKTPYRGRVLLKAWVRATKPLLADSLYVTLTD